MDKLRVLILDFDGVIIESNAVKTEAFRWLFQEFPEHATAMMRFHETNISASRFVKFDHLLKLLGRENDASLRNDIATKFSGRILNEVTKVPMVAGSEEFLRTLWKKIPIYLASVTPEPELHQILNRRNLSHWFCGAYGCPPWTKADAIRAILVKEGTSTNDALLIGDSSGDQRAALETNIHFLARDSGLPFLSPPPQLFPDLHAILKYLQETFP